MSKFQDFNDIFDFNRELMDDDYNDGQLYVVLGKVNEDGRWQLRLWWKPWVTLIWFGGILIALGGILALVGRLWRERRLPTRDDQ